MLREDYAKILTTPTSFRHPIIFFYKNQLLLQESGG